MEKTWKPTTAGILDIISGVLGLIGAISYFIAIGVVGSQPDVPGFVLGILWGLAFPSIIIGILALVGGIYSVQRKKWGWALAGSIAAILAFLPLGILATIFAAMSRDEFE